MVSQQTKSRPQMSITAVIIAIILPVACVAGAAALMRLFDVGGAAVEQAQFEAEKLLAQANREVKIRHRVRAGAPSHVTLADFPHFAPLSATRIRFPSA